MAQIVLRQFDPSIGVEVMEGLCSSVKNEVFRIHYPNLVSERNTRRVGLLKMFKIDLEPGDITLVVPQLDLGYSESDADFEVEISEGSENWPPTVDEVQERARKLSGMLQIGFPDYAHNIFEITGIGNGWAQYKPNEI